MINRLLSLILLCLFISVPAFAGVTGKIAGKVTSSETGEPLIGINVIIEGTTLGAATDLDGTYVINNVEPGAYAIIVSGIGYQKKKIENVKVASDYTTNVDVTLSSDVVTLDAVIVQAEAPLIRKDLTSSKATIDAGQIETLPVESIDALLSLQAGITRGAGGELHIRGGRSTEIAYTVNGVSISNPFDNSRTVNISTNAIQELSVVSGTFNAEYGNALSGIVNTITKEGGSEYKAFLSFYTGDYISSRKDVFFNIDAIDPINKWVGEGTLSGPVPGTGNNVTFFLSGRYDDNKGYLYGVRQHNPTDSVFIDTQDKDDIRIASTGDGAVVPMNTGKDYNLTGKFTFKPWQAVKINYDVFYSNAEYTSYNHDLKYNPDANYNRFEWGLLNSLELRHAINSSTFYTVKGSYNINDYKRYLYPLLDADGNAVSFNPSMDLSLYHPDPRYQPDHKRVTAANYTFLSGGTLNGHYYQRSNSYEGKFDIESQVNNNHAVKFGINGKYHEMSYVDFDVLRDSTNYLEPTIPALNTSRRDQYTKYPVEVSAYIQDKMEFESLVLNVGLRYDFFKSNSRYSTNQDYPTPYTRNPLPPSIDPNSLLAEAPAKHMLSPRFGLSFPVTDKGIIHFSYGHFYQIPPYSYLYTNPYFEALAGTPVYGNANLNPEKTVSYEIGLQQQLTDNLAFNVTGFYKDVRDLLALQEIRVSTSDTYRKYVNKDYGNIKGITFSLTKRRSMEDMFSATIDYTFQVAEGNDVSAAAFFLDTKSGRQAEKIPVPLAWDQTHTLNGTASVGQPRNWNITLVGKVGTGLPYTPEITDRQIFLRANSGRRPFQASVDLLAEKSFKISGVDLTLFMKIYNLFDSLNERFVYNDTGRATYTLEEGKGSARAANELAERVPGAHSATEYFVRPDYYAAPREVRLGMSLDL